MKRRLRTPRSTGNGHHKTGREKGSNRVPVWQAILLPVAAILIFFLLLEGGLALFGVRPTLQSEDPFVGFASNVPLFVPTPGPGGLKYMTTAENKLNNFNKQSFPAEKPAGAYRIFTLGGSTTYGRPYNDVTSFSAWLREFLPAADPGRKWEVINAGGISYASYRVAHLMEELVDYQPDLFIIYTGHNEFLEERTYGQIRDMSPLLRSTVSVLAKTRTWSAMSQTLEKFGFQPEKEEVKRDNLAIEVTAILDHSAGLDRYTRDATLQQNILEHYRISLERMVALARSAGAEVMFVTPASSLNDCSPFKSEHTDYLDPEARAKSKQYLLRARELVRAEQWAQALPLLDEAVELDPRHAELQYRRGQTLLALGRHEEAETALRLARDEDVCPLRALTPMRQILAEVAEEQDVALVDYVALIEQRMRDIAGHPVPGEELFLDHVHPTIEGHKILAQALLRAMHELGWARIGSEWDDKAVANVTKIINSRIDRETHGRALASLARVLLWARKLEDAARLALEAQKVAGEYRQVAVDSASILSSVYVDSNQPRKAVDLLHASLEKAPGAIELRLKLGETLLDPPFLSLEEAAANLLLVCQQLPHFDSAHAYYGLAMAKRGRTLVAYDSLMEAFRLNPKNRTAQSVLAQIRPRFGTKPPRPQTPQVMLEIYPSQAPRKLVQVRIGPQGRFVPHGVEVEFHENGRLKRFADVEWGKLHGMEKIWDKNGNLASTIWYQEGSPATN